jgi:predicted dienelactone hydrolase
MRSRLAFAFLLVGLCAWRAPAPDAAEPYKPSDGPYRVQTIDELILHDAKREKDLPIKIYYPARRGPFPLIIFSHGAGGSKDGYSGLTRYWASHGYVCIQPTHADSVSSGKTDRRAISLREIVGSAVRDTKGWEDRPRDISFIIDSLPDLPARAPQLKGKIARRSIGVGGHSYGAYTAQLIGGATITVAGHSSQSLADQRVRCILVMSGQGRGQQGLSDHSWDALTCPMMTMTGSRDQGASGQGPEWRKEPFDFSPPGNKYHVLIDGANHFSFTGRLLESRPARAARAGLALDSGADQQAVFSYIRMAGLAFWDAYLKKQKKAAAYLHSYALGGYSHGAVKLFWK